MTRKRGHAKHSGANHSQVGLVIQLFLAEGSTTRRGELFPRARAGGIVSRQRPGLRQPSGALVAVNEPECLLLLAPVGRASPRATRWGETPGETPGGARLPASRPLRRPHSPTPVPPLRSLCRRPTPLFIDPADSAPPALAAPSHAYRFALSPRPCARVNPAPSGCHIRFPANAWRTNDGTCAASLAWSFAPAYKPPSPPAGCSPHANDDGKTARSPCPWQLNPPETQTARPTSLTRKRNKS